MHLIPGPTVLRQLWCLGRQRAARASLEKNILLKVIQSWVSKAGGQTKVFALTIVSHFNIPCPYPTRGNLPCRTNKLGINPLSSSQDWPRTLGPILQDRSLERKEQHSHQTGSMFIRRAGGRPGLYGNSGHRRVRKGSLASGQQISQESQ